MAKELVTEGYGNGKRTVAEGYGDGNPLAYLQQEIIKAKKLERWGK